MAYASARRVAGLLCRASGRRAFGDMLVEVPAGKGKRVIVQKQVKGIASGS
jgi:hypothetical protein